MATEYLTAKDIAAELKVSRSRAYAIARECTRLIDGRSIRVTRASFEVWKRLRTCDALTLHSSSVAAFGGARSQTQTAAVGSRGRRGASTETRPSTSGKNSSVDPLDLPISTPKPRRCPQPSKLDETSGGQLVALRGR